MLIQVSLSMPNMKKLKLKQKDFSLDKIYYLTSGSGELKIICPAFNVLCQRILYTYHDYFPQLNPNE